MSKRTPALGFILVTVLIDIIGLGIIIPVVPELLLELGETSIGDAALTGGVLIFSYAIVQFFFAPILGGLSDQYGRRVVILIALFGLSIDYLFVAFATSISILFVGRIIAGICGASFTTASAYIADVSPPEKRAQNFGLLGAAFGVGFILGPIIGGLLGGIGLRVPFFVAAGLTLVNWLYGYFILPESLAKENRRKFDIKRANPVGSLMSLKKYPVILGLIMAFFFLYIAGHSVQSNWSYFGTEVFGWKPMDIGLSLSFVGLMIALVQGLLVKLVVNKFGQRKTVYMGLAINCIGLLLFSMVTELWQLYVVLAVYALGGVAGPTLQGIMSTQVPANEQGELMGAVTSLQSLANIFGPLIMTGIFAFFTTKSGFYFPGAAFALGSLFSLTCIIFAVRTLRNFKLT
jgi:MFS transporter, DHA1 family, tetracycline resistance protein